MRSMLQEHNAVGVKKTSTVRTCTSICTTCTSQVLKYQKKKELYCCVFRRRGNLETPTRSNIRVRTEQTVFKKPRTCVLP